MSVVLGIDAGGTKTHCLLVGDDGEVLAESRGPRANLSTAGELAVEKTLYEVIDTAVGDRRASVVAIGLGMAGVDRPTDARIVREILDRLGFKRVPTVVANDALVALMAGSATGPALMVLSGTGAIALGRNADNEAARSAGWGYILADEGSGFWIGRRALTAVMREYDGRGPATSLTPAVLTALDAQHPTDVIRFVYGNHVPLAKIADIARLVGMACEEGDGVAMRIIDEAAEELVLAGSAVVRRLRLADETFPLFLAGGVFGGLPSLRAAFAERVRVCAPGAELAVLDAPPALGAARMALAEHAGGFAMPTYI
jgi:glucosamine kinase